MIELPMISMSPVRRSCRWWLQAVVLVGVVLTCCLGQNAQPSSSNKVFDPADAGTTLDCDIPAKQTKAFVPQEGMCANVEDEILQNSSAIETLSQAYAPYLYFHPLEEFTMSSVNRTFGNASAGQIYLSFNGVQLFDEALNLTTLMLTTRSRNQVMFSHEFWFEHELSNYYKRGDGFDPVTGLSNAPIYFRPFDSGSGTLTFHYFMYYTWAGPTGVGLLSSYNDTDQYQRMVLPPWGAHEGDWKTFSVTVCKHATPSQPLVLTYRQRNFGQQQDCTAGECTFHTGSETNPVGFVSHFSHHVYPISVEELVYDQAYPLDPFKYPLEFWVNLQGVLMVDRTAFRGADGSIRRFVPTSANIERIAEQVDIPDFVSESEYWQAFGGRWGRSAVEIEDLVSEYPTCITNDTLAYIKCPNKTENPIFITFMQILGLNSSSNPLVLGAKGIWAYFKDKHTQDATGPLGPPTLPFYSRLDGVGNADIWSNGNMGSATSGLEYCARLSIIPNTTLQNSDVDVLPLTKNVVGVVLLCVCFTFISVTYFIWWKTADRVKPIIEKDNLGRFKQPELKNRQWVYAKAWLYTFAWLVTLGGAILFIIGYDLLWTLIEDTFPNFKMKNASAIFLSLGIIILIFDTILLIAVWLRTNDLWIEINETYFAMVDDKEGLTRFKRFAFLKYDHGRINTFFLVCYSFMLLSLVLAVLMVVIGIFNVGFSYAVGYICRAAVGSLDGVCFSFPALGAREVRCGADFQSFCNSWAQKEMVLTLWGAFTVVCGHFFLIAAGGMSVLHNRHAKRALALLPTPEEYAQGFTHTCSKSSGEAHGNTQEIERPSFESSEPRQEQPKEDNEGAKDHNSEQKHVDLQLKEEQASKKESERQEQQIAQA